MSSFGMWCLHPWAFDSQHSETVLCSHFQGFEVYKTLFMGISTLEVETSMLYQNTGNQTPSDAVLHQNWYLIHIPAKAKHKYIVTSLRTVIHKWHWNLTWRGTEAWNSQDIYRITLKGCDVAEELDLEVKEDKKTLMHLP